MKQKRAKVYIKAHIESIGAKGSEKKQMMRSIWKSKICSNATVYLLLRSIQGYDIVGEHYRYPVLELSLEESKEGRKPLVATFVACKAIVTKHGGWSQLEGRESPILETRELSRFSPNDDTESKAWLHQVADYAQTNIKNLVIMPHLFDGAKYRDGVVQLTNEVTYASWIC